MHCPFCNHTETKVIDSRLVAEGSQVRRRRECLECTERFTSFETFELAMPRIIKSDGKRAPFDEAKLRKGIMRAVEKRPISEEQISTTLNRIFQRLRKTGEREIKSKFVGEVVMDQLRELDDVAYVRFASVYRNFQDLSEFRDALDDMEKK